MKWWRTPPSEPECLEPHTALVPLTVEEMRLLLQAVHVAMLQCVEGSPSDLRWRVLYERLHALQPRLDPWQGPR